MAAEAELRDYFRLPVAGFKQAVAELVEDGVLRPVTVRGWKQPAYLHHDARLPRRVRAATLVSPFDPLIWERSRTERLFDMSLPDRDLRAGRTAAVRLLRAAVPAG